jgi:predicted Zn-dependent peptidase
MTRADRSRLPALAATPSFRFPQIARRLLANGLEVRVISHRTVPVVAASLLVRGGTAADPGGSAGLTAFTTDLLDEGSAGRSAIEVSDLIARYGGDLDIDVGSDAVVIGMTMLSRFARPALALLAEMVREPNLADPDIERVRKLRLERLRQLRDHAPAVAERAFFRVLYGDHPYGHLGLGSEPALERITAADVREFQRAMFVPDGATLVIAGDAEPEELFAVAEGAFGGWPCPPGALVDREAGRRAPPLQPEHRIVVVPRTAAAQSELRIGQVCTSRDTPDYHALVVLNAVLGGQFMSRVNMNLRQDKGYTYGVRTGFDLRRGPGPFALQTSVQTEVTAAAAREAHRELADIRGSRPVTAEELALARASLTQGFARNFETAQQVARSVAQLALHHLPDTYFEEFIPTVEAVALTDLTRVAGEYLEPGRMLTLAVGDADKIAASLTELGLGEPVIVSPP